MSRLVFKDCSVTNVKPFFIFDSEAVTGPNHCKSVKIEYFKEYNTVKFYYQVTTWHSETFTVTLKKNVPTLSSH